MFSDALMTKIHQYYPVQISSKDRSPLMKALGTILFFAPTFMVDYTTTIGDTVYYPTQQFINTRPVTSLVVLLHELIHIHDAHKITKFLFSFLYLFPQILAPFACLLFLLSWKIALPVLLLLASPIPAYFRMYFERRAYMVSLYVMNHLNKTRGYAIDLDAQKDFFLSQFKGSYYYWMWIFSDIDTKLNNALALIKDGKRPYNSPVFDMIDDILTQV